MSQLHVPHAYTSPSTCSDEHKALSNDILFTNQQRKIQMGYMWHHNGRGANIIAPVSLCPPPLTRQQHRALTGRGLVAQISVCPRPNPGKPRHMGATRPPAGSSLSSKGTNAALPRLLDRSSGPRQAAKQPPSLRQELERSGTPLLQDHNCGASNGA